MDWYNYYGLAIMAVILVPNIVYALKHKDDDEGSGVGNKKVEVLEQFGRYGCFALMVFNIPYVCLGFWFDHALIIYLSVNGGLCLAYVICWLVFRGGKSKAGALTLSILPSCVFLFSGITLAYIPLIACALLFAAVHIFISYKSVIEAEKNI